MTTSIFQTDLLSVEDIIFQSSESQLAIIADIVAKERVARAASLCCGENAPDIYSLTPENVISIRNKFLNNVQYNGARSHYAIIAVLEYMSKFIPKEKD